MRGVALFCVSLGLAGCSLFLSTSDFAGGAEGDAGSVTPDASDAPATPSEEGGSDANHADGSTGTFCASLNPKPKFCADFDDSAGVAKGWDGLLVDPPGVGSMTLDPLGRDRSAALAKLDAPQGCSYVRPQTSFPTDGKGLRFSFSFRPSATWDGDAAFAYVKLEKSACGLLFHFDGSGAALHEQYGAENPLYDWLVSPKVDVWSKIEMSLAADATIEIKVDGVTAISRKLDDGCTFGDGVFVAPGFHCEADVHEARYDDVVVDYP